MHIHEVLQHWLAKRFLCVSIEYVNLDAVQMQRRLALYADSS